MFRALFVSLSLALALLSCASTYGEYVDVPHILGYRPSQVRRVLGEPIETRLVGAGEIWYYPEDAHLVFSSGRVKQATSTRIRSTRADSGSHSTAVFESSSQSTSSKAKPSLDPYGTISPITGRPKVVPVRGYYRKDGTYVRPHYRSRSRR